MLTLAVFNLNFGAAHAISADQNTLNSWAGKSAQPQNNLLKSQNKNFSSALANAFGFELPQPQSQTQYFSFQPGKIYQFMKTVANSVDADTVEPVLKIENNRVVEFEPAQNGQTTDLYASTIAALNALEANAPDVDLVVRQTVPQETLAQTNNLGINELIAEGESNFAGSPSNRRHNIKVGVEKMKGVIIQKGEEFSFNKYLGPVEAADGFLPELVIKKNGTVPELGGGLCQVSTTTFRAAMNAGLPITERRNHAYAVSYYAPQGTDATIYPGVVDLKFINDTPGAILVWPYIKDPNTLIFDFYGTKDSRQVTLEKPIQWDRKPDGSMKASWTREIFNNSTTTTETFKSVYRSPALFHKTEEFVSPTATPNSIIKPTTN